MESAVATTPVAKYAEGVIAAALRSASAEIAREARTAYEHGAGLAMQSLVRDVRALGMGSAGRTLHDSIGQAFADVLAAASREVRFAVGSAARDAAFASRQSSALGLASHLRDETRHWSQVAAFSRSLDVEPSTPDEEAIDGGLDWNELYGRPLRDLQADLHAQVQGPTRWQIMLLIAVCYFVLGEQTKEPAYFVCGAAYVMLARDYARHRN